MFEEIKHSLNDQYDDNDKDDQSHANKNRDQSQLDVGIGKLNAKQTTTVAQVLDVSHILGPPSEVDVNFLQKKFFK